MHKSASTYMCEKCIASASICNLIGSCCQGWSSTRAMKIICQMFCSTYLRPVFGMQTIWRQEDGNIAPTDRADRVDGKIQHHLPVLRPFRHRSWCRIFSINHISWIKLCAIQSGQEGPSNHGLPDYYPFQNWLICRELLLKFVVNAVRFCLLISSLQSCAMTSKEEMVTPLLTRWSWRNLPV